MLASDIKTLADSVKYLYQSKSKNDVRKFLKKGPGRCSILDDAAYFMEIFHYSSIVTRPFGDMFRRRHIEYPEQEKPKYSDYLRENMLVGKAYDYIAYDPFEFTIMLIVLKKLGIISKGMKFLDAGGGIGDKCYIASLLGMKVTNLEISSTLLKELSELYGDSIPAVRGDITEFDYSGHDIIYAYNPICSTDGMIKFFNQVMKTARPDTVLIFLNVHYGFDALSTVMKEYPGKITSVSNEFGKALDGQRSHDVYRVL